MSTPYDAHPDTNSSPIPTPTPTPTTVGNQEPNLVTPAAELDQPTEEEDDNNNDVTECVVCQNAPLTHVLLPCRHACACASCFRQLERCPLCRGMIEAYFLLTHEEDDNELENSSSTESLPWFEDAMERIHNWLTDIFDGV